MCDNENQTRKSINGGSGIRHNGFERASKEVIRHGMHENAGTTSTKPLDITLMTGNDSKNHGNR